MARIIDLDELTPDDFEFKFRGESYFVRGDLTVVQALSLLKLVVAFNKEENELEQEKLLLKMEADLLEVFRERQPDLERLPFGLQGVQQTTIALLKALGVLDDAEAEAPESGDPTTRPAKARPKSSRSTGSRR